MNTKIYESVGVPEGIVKSGQRLYDDFKKEVIPLLKDGQTEYQVNFKPKEPYKVGDEEITNVEINLTIIPDSDDYGESNMQVYRKNTIGKVGNDYVLMKVNKNGTIILSIDKPVPEEWSVQEVIDSNTEMFNFPIGAIQRVFYDLYYLDDIENSVRPTELYAKLETKGIGKSEFLDYLRKEYFIVMESMKFSVDDMIKEIYKDMDSVDSFLGQVGDLGKNIEDLTDEEKVNLILRIAYVSASNSRRQNYGDSLVDNPLESQLGFVGDKDTQFSNYEKSFDKYDKDLMKFYTDIEKYLRTTSTKVLKKLGKVYSLLPD